MAPLTTDDAGTSDGHAASTGGDGDGIGRVIALAEELLTRRHGATVRLADPADLGGSTRSLVVRVRVAENPFSLPRTLVLKHYLDEPGAREQSTDRFRYEAASCQLLTAMPSEERASPMLVANDPAHRLPLGQAVTAGEGPGVHALRPLLLRWPLTKAAALALLSQRRPRPSTPRSARLRRARRPVGAP